MAIRVAINGAGRIGRAFYKLACERPEIEVVAINDLGDKENLDYLFKHDSVYGKWEGELDAKFLQEKNPSKLPWKELDIDVVIESTGFFASYAGSKAHLDAGAKRVVVTAPMRDKPVNGIEGGTVLMGVNEEKLSTCLITSNASCTTNAGSPLIAILDETIGIEKAVLNTVHGYTASQSLVDGPSKRGFREGRAAAQNIVPSSTGAAIAVTEAFTKLHGLFDGIAMRVPVVVGSIVDVTFVAKRETTVEEVNNILKRAAGEERWNEIFTVTEEELVSSDILGSPYGSIADLNFTRVVGGNLVKVLAWYDNEVGYCHTLLSHVIKFGSYIK
ncbi:MAG: glyceraldehyde 3-phosphate dehydrogenase NAD-binding domain-containing protein [Patescibacteria group bacterium]|nr:glyceraldehyde 3-phosphate dehydrogenase NAD-binding domain-containing protein [Patescibacteria group bacterium]